MSDLLKLKRKLKGILFINEERKKDRGILSYLPRVSLGLVVVLFITFLFPLEPIFQFSENQELFLTPWQVILPFLIRFVLI
ncbi:MAG: hypothetical protein Q8N71_01590, partial [candidate division Zixibacteria bacterium]|nr:hypothetical protein [candidate division Zixibacteria bacterium]